MKKLILAAFFAFGMNVIVAQTNTGTPQSTSNNISVPSTITNKFSADYPNIHPTWRMDEGYYVADYMDQGMGRAIYYDKSANIMRTDKEINRDIYPDQINQYYTTNYPNEKYKIWSSEDGEGNMNYYSKRKNKLLWFDKNGKYMDKKPGKKNSLTKQ
jgi:hypothetical protein